MMTYLKFLGQSLLFWSFVMIAQMIIRYVGVYSEDGIRVIFDVEYTVKGFILFGLLTGLQVGFLYSIVQSLIEKFISKRLSLLLILTIESIAHFFVLIVALTLVLYQYKENNSSRYIDNIWWWVEDGYFWSTLFYVSLASVTFSFIRIVSTKFGKGVLLKMLLGKYKKPKEEKRIFMFLDLKSSTTIAEELGHFRYSQLIQDCFYDLNEIVPKYEAEIYQYVGDEAVLSWPYEKGLANQHCVSTFFDFQQLLLSKKEWYQNKYGMVPEFKAGLHGGVLMVAEVGVVKKELAYHGDVINTSARIQAECNRYGVPLLVSGSLLKDLNIGCFFSSKHLGSVVLKGKRKEVNIHTIDISINWPK